jgi:hypothetical protein
MIDILAGLENDVKFAKFKHDQIDIKSFLPFKKY